jgi:hypothetical protein
LRNGPQQTIVESSVDICTILCSISRSICIVTHYTRYRKPPLRSYRPQHAIVDSSVDICEQAMPAASATAVSRQLLSSSSSSSSSSRGLLVSNGELLYSWTQTSGPRFDLSLITTTQFRLILPPFTLDTYASYTFELTVTLSDGRY